MRGEKSNGSEWRTVAAGPPTAVVFGAFGAFRVLVVVGQAGTDQLLQDGLGDGHDHGRGGRVAEPHGQEDRAAHEAQHQPTPRGVEGGGRLSVVMPLQLHQEQDLMSESESANSAHMPGLAPAIITMRKAMRL